MGDLHTWLHHGVRGEFTPPPSPAPAAAQPENPPPSDIDADSWRQSEQATQEIIHRIQPTLVSEERRRAVLEYVQNLIRGHIGTEVFAFGSVPLKTYLPDGDIDLTAIGPPNSEDALAIEVRSVLEAEEQRQDDEFEVKDVQYIHAEVKLVKCMVQNIVVDISFNQIGGLCTLCFLERVDDLIGKDHLFKRSIILIKAWCYYESRILGAHHGLISTYALETLVLYVFHLFNSTLGGPLAVLYRFLDYYSKFDWDAYCISLQGPVAVSSLPTLMAEAPEIDEGNFLLTKEFLKDCVEKYAVPTMWLGNTPRAFAQKHLNIFDPLRENNNLGRSVSKSNFYRIRSAFAYGARKLGRILQLPGESIADEINTFFLNTLDRHGSGERPDVQDVLESCMNNTILENGIDSLSSVSKIGECREATTASGSPVADCNGVVCEEFNQIRVSGSDVDHTRIQSERHSTNYCQHLAANSLQEFSTLESDGLLGGNNDSRIHLVGAAKDGAANRASGSSNGDDTLDASPSSSEIGVSPSRKACYAPHLFFQPGNIYGNQILDPVVPSKVDAVKPSSRAFGSVEESARSLLPDSYETESFSSTSSWKSSNLRVSAAAGLVDGSTASCWRTYHSENSHLGDGVLSRSEGHGTSGNPNVSNLADLIGDYSTQFNILRHVQACYEYWMGLFPPNPRSSPSPYHNKHLWDSVRRQGMFMHMNANGVVHGPPLPPGCYPANQPYMSSNYGVEDLPKPRGTGTYFPNTNFHSYRERLPPGRGRNMMPGGQLPRARNNGRPTLTVDVKSEKGSLDPPLQPQLPNYSGNGRGKPALLDLPLSSRPDIRGASHANGFVLSEGKLEFGSLGSVPLRTPPAEVGKALDSSSPHNQGSVPAANASDGQRPGTSSNRERAAQSYQLKDEGDFPPLSG